MGYNLPSGLSPEDYVHMCPDEMPEDEAREREPVTAVEMAQAWYHAEVEHLKETRDALSLIPMTTSGPARYGKRTCRMCSRELQDHQRVYCSILCMAADNGIELDFDPERAQLNSIAVPAGPAVQTISPEHA